MSGETEQNVSGWTVDTLNAHWERRHADLIALLAERKESQEVAVRAAIDAAEKATIKAESATEKRFESVNEFRAQLTDQAATFVTRTEFDLQRLNYTEKIEDLTKRINRSEGKGAGLNAAWVYLLAGVAALGTIVSIYLATK